MTDISGSTPGKSPFDKLVTTMTTTAGEIPVLKDIWEFFSLKGSRTNYYTINSENSFTVDLEFAEALGCPLNILTNKSSIKERWDIVQKTLKQRKIADEDKALPWLEGVQKKWVLPKNILVKLVPDFHWTTLKENASDRIDLLKIELQSEADEDAEHMMLYSLLKSGYRPGLLLLNYYMSPDEDISTMLLAGHIQNSGYRLLKQTSNKWFLYVYTDVCVYETCSWTNSDTQNPLVHYFAALDPKKSFPTVEKTS